MTLNKEIFKIAIPNILANISIPLLGIVDTALMGRMDDPAYIGAIAIGGIIFNILYWGLGFLRPGTTGLTAQAFGAGEIKRCYRILYRAFLLAGLMGFLLLVLYYPIGELCFWVLSGSEKVELLAWEYYRIRILAAPAVIIILACRGWFFGMQDAVSPMILTIVVNALNILFSWYLVIHKGLSVQGVAWGTVIAQYLTLILVLVILVIKYRHRIKDYLDKQLLLAKELKPFLSINRDMFIRNIGMILVFSFFTNHASKLGDRYLAVNQILLQLFYFMSYAVDGFAYASESLVGKYLGKMDYDKLIKAIRYCLIYGLVFGCMYAVLFIFLGEYLVGLFTDDADLIFRSKPYYLWLSVVSITGALAFIWDGVYGGATASVELRNSMMLSVAVFFIAFYCSDIYYPQFAIWIGMSGFMLARSIFQIFYYWTSLKEKWAIQIKQRIKI